MKEAIERQQPRTMTSSAPVQHGERQRKESDPQSSLGQVKSGLFFFIELI